MQITNRIVVQSTVALLGVGFLALIVIIGMTFWLGERSQIYFDEVIEARDTRGAAVELRSALQAAESSQRGFLFTGNEIYLAPYETAKRQIRKQLTALKLSVAPYQDVASSVAQLETIITTKIAEIEETIRLKRARQDPAALAAVRTNRGKALMDEANVFFSGIIRTADDRLTTGVGEQRENAALLRWFAIIGGIVIVAVVGGATVTALRYMRALREARDAVDLLNAGLEERVRDRTADLAEMNEEIQRFAFIVTHDLRAPLVNIMGFTGELAETQASFEKMVRRLDPDGSSHDPDIVEARLAASEELPEAISFIKSSTAKMDSLIGAILKLAREGRRSPKPEPLDLGALLAASAAAVQHQVSQADGLITLDLEVASVVHDKLSLEQVFGNLFDNAVKYRSPKRPLSIAVKARVAPRDRITIEIADNGRGIADEDKERVFELFRRSGPQDQRGEGLGLAYVRTIMRNLGGDITMKSALEEGTVFRLNLPRVLRLADEEQPSAGL